jgi:hypothetical protein
MPVQSPREIKESPLFQGENEKVAYDLTTTPWGGSPANEDVKIFDSDDNDVSSTKLSGSNSVSGDVITTKLVQSLVAGEWYRLKIQWTNSGNTFEAYTIIYAEE